MSDFLTTLVARTVGSAQVVGPRRPTRFETGAAGPTFDERSDVEPTTASSVAPRSPGRFPPEPLPVHRRDHDMTRPHAESLESAMKARPSEVVQPEVVRRGPVVETSTTGGPRRESETPAVRAEAVATIRAVRPVSASPQTRNAASRTDSPARHQAEPAPAIHVTIGRVEVRAIHRPDTAPSSRPAPAPAAPRLSLGSYLRGRRE